MFLPLFTASNSRKCTFNIMGYNSELLSVVYFQFTYYLMGTLPSSISSTYWNFVSLIPPSKKEMIFSECW